ncbi:glycosyltransferase family 2 protein [Francisella sp. SYW-2]|uniref:glycosyltransferase family 2 protein n=1 Tax=Francisella sp. SYW-2 TaxID=2610886 RepID=UPI00123CC268|nr:glycosyltransferase family 2 protein [Francisella sp. SYW-2]
MYSIKEIPNHNIKEFFTQKKEYCVCIPVINEGDKIRKQLERMSNADISSYVDIIICDGGSSDGSLDDVFLRKNNVRVILEKKDTGKLSAQLRMGYYYALEKCSYKGIVTIDGNNKDSVENIRDIVDKLEEGYDLIQASRFIPGGEAINTPLIRHLAVKLIHIPAISYMAGFKYTDTTNGFRGYSRKFLEDSRVEPFRNIFQSYELLAYLSVRAPQLGYKVIETPVCRKYPPKGKIPTKISFVKGNSKLLSILKDLYLHKYDPKQDNEV